MLLGSRSYWFIVAVSLTVGLGACGNESDQDGAENGGGSSGPVEPPPLDAACNAADAVELTSPVEVGDAAELRDALATGGEILLTANIDADGPFNITEPTILDGGGFTISGQGMTHLLVAEAVELVVQHITLADAVNRVADSEPFSQRSGAALTMRGSGAGSLKIFDTRFENNEIGASGPGDLRGGALYAFAVPDVLVVDSEFVSNRGSNGGAIGGLGSSYTILNTAFIDNHTTGTGGPGSLEGRGGAISLDALSQNEVTAYLEICGSHFENNTALHNGGALALVTHQWQAASVDINQSTFINNVTTDGSGGAIYLLDDENYPRVRGANRSRIANSYFGGNHTLRGGGGVWFLTESGSLEVINSTFFENSTEHRMGMGGGVALLDGPIEVTNCTFADNFAQFHGGGIQAGGDADITLTNNLFHNNRSDRDGGWAWFHVNRELNDGGGNIQYLDPDFEIDRNSNELVAAGATIVDAQPMAPADNEGPTHTMALPAGSAAIDAGVSVDFSTDQRGMPHSGAPDVGAYEVQ